MTFTKHDFGKPRAALLPPRALLTVAEVLTYGAQKYGSDNWRHVDDDGRYRDALMRHLLAYLADIDGCDADTKLPHLAHLVTNALFLLELQHVKKENK